MALLSHCPHGVTARLNLRNRYVDGLALEATKQDTVVVLRICVLLRFLGRKAA